MPPLPTFRAMVPSAHKGESGKFHMPSTYGDWALQFEVRDNDYWLFLCPRGWPAAMGNLTVKFKLGLINERGNVCRESHAIEKVFQDASTTGFGTTMCTKAQMLPFVKDGQVQVQVRLMEASVSVNLAEALMRITTPAVSARYKSGLEQQVRDLQARADVSETTLASLHEEHETLVAVHSVCVPATHEPPPKVRVREVTQMEMLELLSEKAGDSWEQPERSLVLLSAASESCKESMAERNTCVVCMSGARTFVYPACGHMCVCEECVKDASISSKCPVCKKDDQVPVKVFR